jgi:hypothetical protein
VYLLGEQQIALLQRILICIHKRHKEKITDYHRYNINTSTITVHADVEVYETPTDVYITTSGAQSVNNNNTASPSTTLVLGFSFPVFSIPTNR